MIVRETTKNRITSVLDNSAFTKFAFDISYSGKDNDFINIKYIPNTTFFFKVSREVNFSSGEDKFAYVYSPGTHFTSASRELSVSFETFFTQLDSWLKRLLQELQASSPLIHNTDDILKNLQKEFDEKIDSMDGEKTTYFTTSEASKLSEKLDSLYESFENLKAENSIKDAELKELKKELEKLKEAMKIMPKQSWYKVAGKKIMDFMGKYAAGEIMKQLAGEVAKKLLDQ